MRSLADAPRIREFMRVLGQRAHVKARVYFTGGATAVLEGWRATTIDVDIEIVPDSDAVLRELPALKDQLSVNLELASAGALHSRAARVARTQSLDRG